MKISVYKNAEELGEAGAEFTAEVLNRSIKKKGKARLVLSTGESQLATINALVKKKIDWRKVEMFHLDEYIGLPEIHPASFRKYLKDRFINIVTLKSIYLVNVEGDIKENIKILTKEIRREPIDLALIGVGVNAHIAFNDPPADFNTKEAFITVELDDTCKRQQVREGWFSRINDVPANAVTMTPYQIMQSKVILSCVPYQIKANAVKNLIESDTNKNIPASILKIHDNFFLFLDRQSASNLPEIVLKKYE